MPSIPLIVVWFSVLSVYLPYNMGFAFLNPIVLTAYGFLGWLTGANLPDWRKAFLASAVTTLAAILLVNLSSGIPHLVLPAIGILLSSLTLSASSALATSGIRAALHRRGLPEDAIRLRLRLGFAAFAVALYFNGLLPYSTKMWIAERTTNPDLIFFSAIASAVFVGTWRLTR